MTRNQSSKKSLGPRKIYIEPQIITDRDFPRQFIKRHLGSSSLSYHHPRSHVLPKSINVRRHFEWEVKGVGNLSESWVAGLVECTVKSLYTLWSQEKGVAPRKPHIDSECCLGTLFCTGVYLCRRTGSRTGEKIKHPLPSPFSVNSNRSDEN